MEKLGPGRALGAMCSFWEVYINTGWDEEGKEGAVAAGCVCVCVKKQPRPCQLSLCERKE